MRKTFYVVNDSNGKPLTDRILDTRDEALKLIDFYGLTDILYEIKEYYCHESPDDPDRQRRSKLRSMTKEERIAERAEREKIKAKALKK